MRRRQRFNVVLAALSMTFSIAAADEIRRWKDPQGREHVTIVGDDEPGAGGASTSEPTAEDRLSVDASLRRRDLERRLFATTEQLKSKRKQIDGTEKTKYEIARLPTPVELEERRRVEDLRRNAILGADAFAAEKRRRLFHLRRDERAILIALNDLWRDFDRLRDEVRTYYGRLPQWWNDRLRCPGCPTPPEIAEALSRNEVEVVTTADPTPTP